MNAQFLAMAAAITAVLKLLLGIMAITAGVLHYRTKRDWESFMWLCVVIMWTL